MLFGFGLRVYGSGGRTRGYRVQRRGEVFRIRSTTGAGVPDET